MCIRDRDHETEKENEIQPEIKIGDRVKIIGNSNYHYHPIGSIGKVTEIKTVSYSNPSYKVTCDNLEQRISPADLERA